MTRRHLLTVKLGAAVLAIAVAIAGAEFLSSATWAQESEHAGGALDLSNRHSMGWHKALQLKGPPVAPKFPKLGTEVSRDVLLTAMKDKILASAELHVVYSRDVQRAVSQNTSDR